MHPVLQLMVTGKTRPLKAFLKGAKRLKSNGARSVLYQQLECVSSLNSRMGFNGKGQVYRYSIMVIPCLWLHAYSVVRPVAKHFVDSFFLTLMHL
jgi:hypothetical protein